MTFIQNLSMRHKLQKLNRVRNQVLTQSIGGAEVLRVYPGLAQQGIALTGPYLRLGLKKRISSGVWEPIPSFLTRQKKQVWNQPGARWKSVLSPKISQH